MALAVAMIFALMSMPAMADDETDAAKDVCIIYFTGQSCGDDCRLTDTFMDGLIYEYRGNNLITVTYDIDAGTQNRNVFEAYRQSYSMPANLPIVLFGKDDYLYGMDDIYANTEIKIFSFLQTNGTNCPLDSGYVAPIGSGTNLPGSPQIRSSADLPDDNPDEIGDDGEITNDSITGGVDAQNGIFMMNEPMRESVLSLAIIGIVLIIATLILIYVWGKV